MFLSAFVALCLVNVRMGVCNGGDGVDKLMDLMTVFVLAVGLLLVLGMVASFFAQSQSGREGSGLYAIATAILVGLLAIAWAIGSRDAGARR